MVEMVLSTMEELADVSTTTNHKTAAVTDHQIHEELPDGGHSRQRLSIE